MITLWQRYFFKEILKSVLLFLFCFFFLYVLIDYSSRSKNFLASSSISNLGLYYSFVYLKHLDILLPFSLLLATLQTLCNLNFNNELIALRASGIKLKVLLGPFLLMGILTTAFMYLDFEILHPYASFKIKEIDSRYNSSDTFKKEGIQELLMADGSLLLYQSYNITTKQFFDAYWIVSLNEIYRIKYLDASAEIVQGHFVDKIERLQGGELKVTESLDSKIFTLLPIDQRLLAEVLLAADEQPISLLWRTWTKEKVPYTSKEINAATWWLRKILMPWLCFLVIIAPAPFCLKFTRQLRIFLIFITSLLGLICFYLVINAATVVAQSEMLTPYIAIGMPFLFAYCFFGGKLLYL